MLDGLSRMLVDDPKFVQIMRRDLEDGLHLNPENHPDYFATAYFHEPSDLEAEIRDAGSGLSHEATLAVEGSAWLMQSFEQHWSTAARRERLMEILRSVETAPSLLGASAHLLAVARKDR